MLLRLIGREFDSRQHPNCSRAQDGEGVRRRQAAGEEVALKGKLERHMRELFIHASVYSI